jgi:hypothetical protein
MMYVYESDERAHQLVYVNIRPFSTLVAAENSTRIHAEDIRTYEHIYAYATKHTHTHTHTDTYNQSAIHVCVSYSTYLKLPACIIIVSSA